MAEACRFCRRSHMSCDAGRPCSRCVKRDIAHLCRDEPISSSSAAPASPSNPGAPVTASPKPTSRPIDQTPIPQPPPVQPPAGLSANLLGLETLNGGAITSRPSLSPSLSAAAPIPSMAGPHPGMGQPTMSFGSRDGSGNYGQQQLPMLNTNFNLAMVSRRLRHASPTLPCAFMALPSSFRRASLGRRANTFRVSLNALPQCRNPPTFAVPFSPSPRLNPTFRLRLRAARPSKRARWHGRGIGVGHDDGAIGRIPRAGPFVRLHSSLSR